MRKCNYFVSLFSPAFIRVYLFLCYIKKYCAIINKYFYIYAIYVIKFNTITKYIKFLYYPIAHEVEFHQLENY